MHEDMPGESTPPAERLLRVLITLAISVILGCMAYRVRARKGVGAWSTLRAGIAGISLTRLVGVILLHELGPPVHGYPPGRLSFVRACFFSAFRLFLAAVLTQENRSRLARATGAAAEAGLQACSGVVSRPVRSACAIIIFFALQLFLPSVLLVNTLALQNNHEEPRAEWRAWWYRPTVRRGNADFRQPNASFKGSFEIFRDLQDLRTALNSKI